ncbi:hypothetical protein R1flu_007350 [Riccia fluitans]|uniref:Thioredoxin domain-containing protein n=1 Tax=Riccia fluitans TaxID=41844 RepID=A0ABD1YZ60_9MARC
MAALRAAVAASSCGAVIASTSGSPSSTSTSLSRFNSAVSVSSSAAAAGKKFQGLARSHRRAALRSPFKGVELLTVLTSCSSSRVSRSASAPIPVRAALVQKVTAKELDDILNHQRTSPMIIDFYATWCGPCIVLAQQLEELAVEYGEEVRFLKVDTDEEHELATQMQIRGLPTMVFVSSDLEKLAIRTEGLLPTDTIRNIIENEL